MNRAERREIKERKWVSKLKKLWYSNFFLDRVNEVKSDKSIYRHYNEFPKAESWKDYERDRFGVMLKNTGTICRDSKWLDIKDERKRNVNNRSLSNADKEELNDYLENVD